MDKKLQKNINYYLLRVSYLQQKQLYTADFSSGYYYSKDKKLRKLEDFFLETIPLIAPQLIKELNNNCPKLRQIKILHLLNWSLDYDKTPKVLIGKLNNQDPRIVNAAARSLFSMIYSQKVDIDVSTLSPLIKRKSKYIKNKLLGLLLALPKNKNQEILSKFSVATFKNWTLSKESMVSQPAQILLKRLAY